MDLRTAFSSGRRLILDGAMGTLPGMSGSDVNLTDPERVLQAHVGYIRAGSQALITNTLRLNRCYVGYHDLAVDISAANRAGARLARQAAGADHYVLGNIGPVGKLLDPYGEATVQGCTAAFMEQAALLAEEGVDGFIIETMMDVNEACLAVAACRHTAPSLPVMTSVVFETAAHGGRTLMGQSAGECARKLAEEHADVIGTNCGSLTGPELKDIIGTFRRATSLPLLVELNAGTPTLAHGQTRHGVGISEFVERTKDCIKSGASVVGGCCGTTPEYIAALSKKLRAQE